MKKTLIFMFLIIFLIGVTFPIKIVGAEASYCCEKTTDGKWCVNAPRSMCATGGELNTPAQTHCESTSYCKPGCCFNSQQGTCWENTGQSTCNEAGGVWNESAQCEIPQCDLGCCLIGDQAAFVTQTRCKKLSSLYGLEINFRTDFSSEMMCIASASSDEEGACVFEKEFQKTCLRLTQKQCNEMGDTSFHKGYLCSAESLGTNCAGFTDETTCVEDRDEVFFVDGCGNLANIYDASKQDSPDYWSTIYDKSQSCGYNDRRGNADSKTCGNCEYFSGSTCKEAERSNSPTYGDYVCEDLSCEYEDQTYEHGETWCAESRGIDESLPGSKSFRLVCYDSEVTVEPCAEFRKTVCVQSDVNGFKTAACVANIAEDCVYQDTKKDCENIERRDCVWIAGDRFDKQEVEAKDKAQRKGSCVPKYAPGFKFWPEVGSTLEISNMVDTCSLGTTQCVVVHKKKNVFDDWDCEENCHCLTDEWAQEKNQICSSLGDCGSSTNYIGIDGYYNESSLTKKRD